MSAKKIVVGAGALAMLAGLAVTGTASATAPNTLTVVPGTVQAGHWVQVSVHCYGGAHPTGPATSVGFVGPIALGTGDLGQGQVVNRPGDYEATVSCGNNTWARAEFTVSATPPSGGPQPTPGEHLRVAPAQAAPGQRVQVSGHCDSGVIGPVISDGFVAPVQLNTGWQGQGQAVRRPGHYRASMTCGDGATVWAAFTVGGTPPTTTPSSPTTSPSAPGAQVPVKPVGAPETGAGGMAATVSRW
jgi:hypothetical protein